MLIDVVLKCDIIENFLSRCPLPAAVAALAAAPWDPADLGNRGWVLICTYLKNVNLFDRPNYMLTRPSHCPLWAEPGSVYTLLRHGATINHSTH